MRIATGKLWGVGTLRFNQIQVLRGLAALAVLFCHLPPEITLAVNLPFKVLPGAVGVDVFFIISGFLMMYVTENGTKGFLLKRAVRILPLYWACTVIYGLYYGMDGAEQIIRSLVLTRGQIVGQAWTLILDQTEDEVDIKLTAKAYILNHMELIVFYENHRGGDRLCGSGYRNLVRGSAGHVPFDRFFNNRVHGLAMSD
jgi:hypothetical protein